MTTPTPPADTRQQAVDVLLAHFWAVDDRVCLCGWTPLEAAGQWAWLLENDSPQSEADAAWEAVADEFARHQAAVLASSSPALPEPPAPGREPDWRSPGEIGWLSDGYEVTVDPTPGVTPRLRWQGRVASASWLRGLRDAITAALAAADVAEEQQP